MQWQNKKKKLLEKVAMSAALPVFPAHFSEAQNFRMLLTFLDMGALNLKVMEFDRNRFHGCL